MHQEADGTQPPSGGCGGVEQVFTLPGDESHQEPGGIKIGNHGEPGALATGGSCETPVANRDRPALGRELGAMLSRPSSTQSDPVDLLAAKACRRDSLPLSWLPEKGVAHAWDACFRGHPSRGDLTTSRKAAKAWHPPWYKTGRSLTLPARLLRSLTLLGRLCVCSPARYNALLLAHPIRTLSSSFGVGDEKALVRRAAGHAANRVPGGRTPCQNRRRNLLRFPIG